MSQPYNTTPDPFLSLPCPRRPKGLLRRACEACAGSKSKCDRKHPSCERCLRRSIACKYGSSSTHPAYQQDESSSSRDRGIKELVKPTRAKETKRELGVSGEHDQVERDDLSTYSVSLRWMETMVPDPTRAARLKTFSPLAARNCKDFMRGLPERVRWADERDPSPFIHPSYPLSTSSATLMATTRVLYTLETGSIVSPGYIHDPMRCLEDLVSKPQRGEADHTRRRTPRSMPKKRWRPSNATCCFASLPMCMWTPQR